MSGFSIYIYRYIWVSGFLGLLGLVGFRVGVLVLAVPVCVSAILGFRLMGFTIYFSIVAPKPYSYYEGP